MADSELQRSIALLETARAQLEAMVRQEELIRVSLEEYARARETMARFAETPVGTEILVPIGANSFLFASVGDVERCIVGLGAEVALEDSLEKGMERLDHRMEQLQTVHQNLVRQISETEGKVNQANLAVQQTYQKLQSEGADSGV